MGRSQQRLTSIGFKATENDDADLIAWWEGLPSGERSNTLRDLIRAAMRNPNHIPKPDVPAQPLDRLCEDTAWIRSALMDLPNYLEGLMGRMSVVQPALTGPISETPVPETPQMTQEAIDRRLAKMQQSAW